MLIVVTGVALFLGWRVNHRPKFQAPPSTWTPADVNGLIAYINGPKKRIGFIANIQVPSAVRLGEIGPAAKEYGAVKALEALIANTNDPEAKDAAERALKKINGQQNTAAWFFNLIQ
jgi:hypothetical protein